MTIPPASPKEYGLWLLRQRRLFTVVNESMRPTLKPGDKVFVDPSQQVRQSLKPDDIVVVWHPSHPHLKLIKRIQEVFCDGCYYLISDNLSALAAQDSRKFGPVEPKLIVGRVTSFFHQTGQQV